VESPYAAVTIYFRRKVSVFACVCACVCVCVSQLETL